MICGLELANCALVLVACTYSTCDGAVSFILENETFSWSPLDDQCREVMLEIGVDPSYFCLFTFSRVLELTLFCVCVSYLA